jgi:hypothetical protein
VTCLRTIDGPDFALIGVVLKEGIKEAIKEGRQEGKR